MPDRREKAGAVPPGFSSTCYKLTFEWDWATFFKLAQGICCFSFHSHLWLLSAYPSFLSTPLHHCSKQLSQTSALMPIQILVRFFCDQSFTKMYENATFLLTSLSVSLTNQRCTWKGYWHKTRDTESYTNLQGEGNLDSGRRPQLQQLSVRVSFRLQPLVKLCSNLDLFQFRDGNRIPIYRQIKGKARLWARRTKIAYNLFF